MSRTSHRALAAILAAALLVTLCPAVAGAQASGGFAVQAQSALLLDFNSGQVLYEQAPDTPIPPASLTKIMTLYLAFSAIKAGKLKPEDPVRISKRAWTQNPELAGSSLMFLEPGQRVTVREIMLGIAVPSGNDASVALAEHLAGSVEAFVAQMNDQARAFGLQATTFMDPHGLSEKNLSTARDMAALVTRYIRDYPEALANLHSQKEFTYPKPENLSDEEQRRGAQAIRQENRNRLLWSFPGTDGLKTGYVGDAYGYNLVATARKGEQRLIGILLGAKSEAEREAQAIALLTYGFANWGSVQAFQAGQSVGKEVRVWKGAANAVHLVAAQDLWVAVPKGEEGKLVTTLQADPAERVLAPVARGQELGSAVVVLGTREIGRVPLVAQEEVKAGSLFKRTWDGLRLFLVRLWSRWK